VIDISACLIYRAEDARYLEQMQESLPAGIELCAVQTIEGASPTESAFKLTSEVEHDNGTVVRQAIYQYPRGGFRFDIARNRSLSLARRSWCLAIDADERLISHQWSDWVQATEEAGSKVGGISVNVWGSVPHGHGFARHAGSQVRLFRNTPAIYFRKQVHEFFGLPETIEEAGMELLESTLAIHHVGYETARGELLDKCRRNVTLSCRELVHDPDQPDIQQKLYDTLRLQDTLTG
jgi:hypothetical protein